MSLRQVVFAAWVTLAGHVIVQVEELLTVTTKLQPATRLFAPSLAAQLTCVDPTEKLEPEGGLQVTVTPGVQVVGVA